MTSEQCYFVGRVIREVMQLQIRGEMRRRESQSVPARIFDDGMTRQRIRLGKALLQLRYAGCETLWAMSPDETTMRLFFTPMTSPRLSSEVQIRQIDKHRDVVECALRSVARLPCREAGSAINAEDDAYNWGGAD